MELILYLKWIKANYGTILIFKPASEVKEK